MERYWDVAAGSSSISSTLVAKLRKQPLRKEIKKIKMMMYSTARKIEVYEAKIENISRRFALDVELCKVVRKELISLPNPRYSNLIEKYDHLKGVKMDDLDEKSELPVHIILGVSTYSMIKFKDAKTRVGNPGEPVAEETKFGWTIISLGKEPDITSMMLARNTVCDHDQLCRLDVLGIEDTPTVDQIIV